MPGKVSTGQPRILEKSQSTACAEFQQTVLEIFGGFDDKTQITAIMIMEEMIGQRYIVKWLILITKSMKAKDLRDNTLL